MALKSKPWCEQNRASSEATAARGSDANPFADSDLEAKLRTSAAGWDSSHDITPLIDAIWALDQSTDVSRLAALAVPR